MSTNILLIITSAFLAALIGGFVHGYFRLEDIIWHMREFNFISDEQLAEMERNEVTLYDICKLCPTAKFEIGDFLPETLDVSNVSDEQLQKFKKVYVKKIDAENHVLICAYPFRSAFINPNT